MGNDVKKYGLDWVYMTQLKSYEMDEFIGEMEKVTEIFDDVHVRIEEMFETLNSDYHDREEYVELLYKTL